MIVLLSQNQISQRIQINEDGQGILHNMGISPSVFSARSRNKKKGKKGTEKRGRRTKIKGEMRVFFSLCKSTAGVCKNLKAQSTKEVFMLGIGDYTSSLIDTYSSYNHCFNAKEGDILTLFFTGENG